MTSHTRICGKVNRLQQIVQDRLQSFPLLVVGGMRNRSLGTGLAVTESPANCVHDSSPLVKTYAPEAHNHYPPGHVLVLIHNGEWPVTSAMSEANTVRISPQIYFRPET